MSRVEINAGGRSVVVDHDGKIDTLKATALSLWQATDSRSQQSETVFGFNTERRDTAEVAPIGHGPYGYPPGPVTAKDGQK